jgi:hypothetical protein
LIDIAERAILSVLIQRGGKLPMRKVRPGAEHVIERGGFVDVVRDPPYKTAQFNSRTMSALESRGLVRSRRIFWEITAEGRIACEESRRGEYAGLPADAGLA